MNMSKLTEKLKSKSCGEISCDQCDEERLEAAARIEKLERALESETAERLHFQWKVGELEREVKIWSDQSTLNATRWTDEQTVSARLSDGYLELLGQVEQAREGFGIYHDSPTMDSAIEKARSILLPNAV